MSNIQSFKKLTRSFIIVLFISVLGSLAGYIFHIGEHFIYGSLDEETVGLISGGRFFISDIALVLLPFVIKYEKNKFIKYSAVILSALTYIFILLTLRRTAIMLPLIGYSVFFFFTQRKGMVLRIAIPVAVFILVLFPLYKGMLLERFEARQTMGRFDTKFYESEMRYIKTLETFKKTFSFEEPIHSIFGNNVLAGGISTVKSQRMLHADHNQLLSTTGILGFGIYIIFYLRLVVYFRRLSRFANKKKYLDVLKGLFYALFFMSIAIGFNGSLFSVSFRTLIFFLMGTMMGIFYKNYVLLKKLNHKTSIVSKSSPEPIILRN